MKKKILSILIFVFLALLPLGNQGLFSLEKTLKRLWISERPISNYPSSTFSDVVIEHCQIPEKEHFCFLLHHNFLEREITKELFQELTSFIEDYFDQHGAPLPKIVIPYQDFHQGIVQVYLLNNDEFTENDNGKIVPKTPQSKIPMMPYIKALVLVNQEDEIHELDVKGAAGLKICDLAVPGDIESLECVLNPLYLNQPLTQDLLSKLKRQIILYYKEHYRPIVMVNVPEQDVTDGVLFLVVTEGRLGQVVCEGNRWFSKNSYKRKMHIKSGEPIDENKVLKDVSWLNRNPFRNVDIFFAPGYEEGMTDIQLRVEDQFPVQIFAGGDNTGNDATGNARIYEGITWGNAFWLDHILSYQFTSSTDFKKLKSHSVHYTAPLPWRNILVAYGGYATVHPHIPSFKSKGHMFQSSLRYTLPIGNNYNGLIQELTVGFDYKYTDNNLLFVGEQILTIIDGPVNLTQFLLKYSYAKVTDCQTFGLDIDLFFSPAEFLAHQTNSDYSKLNPHAKSRYFYGKMMVSELYQLPYEFSLFLQGRLQLSSEVLLQSEEFGLGGYDTVRGYEEREFNADNALCINFEIRSPPLSLLKFFNICNVKDNLYFLVFLDYGLGNLNDRHRPSSMANDEPKIHKFQNLLGVGPGMRYTINKYLAFRFDWGINLHRTIFHDGSWSRFHVGLVASY